MKRRYLAVTTCVVILLASCPCALSQTSEPEPSGPFCGVNCLYTALRTEGVEIDLRSLLQPKYIGSESGSTFDELVAAAKDHHAYAQTLGNLSVSDLKNLASPAILHVKSTYDALDYDHFILCVPVRGRLHFYDPPTGASPSSGHELAAVWDGTAIIVSGRPIDLGLMKFWAAARAGLVLAMTFGLAAIALLIRRSYRLRHGEASIGRSAARQGGTLLAVGAVFAIGYHLWAPEGFLAQRQALAMINHSRFDPSPETVDLTQARRLRADGALFVDARRVGDFAAGHIEQAVNLPPNASRIDIDTVLKPCGAGGIVIYCANASCPYADHLAKRLRRYGFTNLKVFTGGWEQWHSGSEDQSSGLASVGAEGGL